MDGVLIKRGEGDYKLFVNDTPFGQSKESPYNKLSIKNCEAIANGYDLDELANRAFDNMGYHSTVTPHEEKQFKLGYRVAFREVLELLGDKKFSEEDVRKAFESGYETLESDRTYNEHYEEMIQSLQKTKWDVEIVMEYQGFEEDGKVREAYLPKLDSNGCIVLKRKI